MRHAPNEYSFIVRRDRAEKDYFARCTEIPGCTGAGRTLGVAVRAMHESVRDFQVLSEQRGYSVPSPVSHDYSGRVLLRLPRSLHGLVAERAAEEGVSLNQYMCGALLLAAAEDGFSRMLASRVQVGFKEVRLSAFMSSGVVVGFHEKISYAKGGLPAWKQPRLLTAGRGDSRPAKAAGRGDSRPAKAAGRGG